MQSVHHLLRALIFWGVISTTTILGGPLFCPVFPLEIGLAEWEAAQPGQWAPASVLVAVALTS